MVPQKKKLRSAHRAGLLLLQVLIPFTLAIGQPGGGDDLDSNPDAAVPVDGGLSLLLAAGAAYGGRRLMKKRAGPVEGCTKTRSASKR
jgi:hypothetical protein